MESKHFLINNQQEWDWLMQKFEAEGIEWRAGKRATELVPMPGYENQVVELDDGHLTHGTRNFYLNALEVTNFIEVGELMEGEYHG